MGVIKQEYVVPDMMELRVDSEKVICASDRTYNVNYTYQNGAYQGHYRYYNNNGRNGETEVWR